MLKSFSESGERSGPWASCFEWNLVIWLNPQVFQRILILIVFISKHIFLKLLNKGQILYIYSLWNDHWNHFDLWGTLIVDNQNFTGSLENQYSTRHTFWYSLMLIPSIPLLADSYACFACLSWCWWSWLKVGQCWLYND